MLDKFFEKLKDIIKIDLRNARFGNFQITIINGAKNGEKVKVSEDTQEISINHQALDESEKILLNEEIKSKFDKKEIDLLETKANDRIEDIKSWISLSL